MYCVLFDQRVDWLITQYNLFMVHERDFCGFIRKNLLKVVL